MKIPNRIHRGSSIVAAVILMVMMLYGTVASGLLMFVTAKLSGTGVNMWTAVRLLINAVTTVLVVIALFRGKKDALAAVIFLIAAAALVGTGVISVIVAIVKRSGAAGAADDEVVKWTIAGDWVAVVATLIGIGFRALMALECFKPGKISGCGKKAFFIILPIVYILLIAASNFIRQGYLIGDYGAFLFFIGTGIPIILNALTSVGWVVLGIAFAIPAYEKKPCDTFCEITE